ncbi:hypothetical protein ACIGO6_20735 [Streptomyces sp. NPDC053750]|uniref:hypothetical protein n=1 Tax=Streptomyces sp. NPDC053750 TaxID=3365714 RepID=UPI0037D568A3
MKIREATSADQSLSRPDGGQVGVEVLNGAQSIRGEVEKLASRTRYQALVCIDPGKWGPEEFDCYHYLTLMSLRRGVALRLLVSRAALDDAVALSYLGRMRREGAEVRVTDGPGNALLLCDGRTAIVSHRGGPWAEEGFVMEERGVVASLSALFQQAWEGAADLRTFADRQVGLQKEDRRLLALIISPGKDVFRARELGVSVRTFHRRVADLYERLGIGNRAEAALVARDYRVLPVDSEVGMSGVPHSAPQRWDTPKTGHADVGA